MDALDLESVTNVWQFLAFIFTVATVAFGGWFMKRTKSEADQEDDSSRSVAKQIADVPKLYDTVEVLTESVKKLAKDNENLRAKFEAWEHEVRWRDEYIAVLASMEEFTDPPFPSIDRWKRSRNIS